MSQDRFKLLPADRMNPLWVTLAKHLNERLSVLRQQNDASLPPEATEKVRGRIAQIKDILRLAEDDPTVS